MKNTARISILFLALVILGSLMLMVPGITEAGIFNASNEVTYKEYWVPHTQFTGGCNADGTPTSPGGSWYMEPHTLAKCPKTVQFTLPDDFSNAAKIEVYLDLWRNYATQAAMFKINDGATTYRPPVGADWSRTPYVVEIDKSEFKVGLNTMTFWGDKRYHVHDIGIRIYYNNSAPLLPGPGSDVEPPNGQLASIQDDSGSVNPNAGGTLTVNSDKLILTADISNDTAYVEFHAWYEGYDEDNDKVFRDWHNSGRNNWWPGGKEAGANPNGGTINHIGTVDAKNGVATITWNLPHITNQPLIKFKIRIVDDAGNVREGAGGVSADFRLMRAVPVNSFILHGFSDFGIHMDGNRPDTASYDFTMPDTVPSYFTNAYLVGAYWRNPNFSLNGSGSSSVASPDWSLGVKSFSVNFLKPGLNRIIYSWSGGTGHFIEEPGPMFVLRRSNPGAADVTPPSVSRQAPLPNATGVDVKSAVVAHLGDGQFGVDWTTVKFTFNGVDVTNNTDIQGTMGDYRLVYDPPGNMAFDTEQTVKIEGCDMVGNCMSPVNYKFNTVAPDTTPPNISNVVVVPLPNGANITWNTNEPATSAVKYGKTQSYELGTKEDLTLKTNHSAEIRGLQPDTLYHFRIQVQDEQANSAQTPDDTFRTSEFGDLLSDDFNYCLLNTGLWEEVDPADNVNWSLDGQTLTMVIPAGATHNWATTGPPRFMQAASDSDFMVEAKFESAIATVGQMQGVLIEEDANNYVRVAYEHSASGPIMFVRFVKDGAVVKNFTRTFTPPTPVPSLMRVKRTGDSFEWFFFENNQWKRPTGAPYSMDMTPLKVGFFAGNTGSGTSAPGHTAVVDYFFNADLPIVPEDGVPISVDVNVVGTGTVVKLPDKAAYSCGESVVLSASTVPGWSFEGWSGGASGSSPTTSVTIDGPKDVTATFTQDQYLLNVVIDNNGIGGAGNVVTKSPDQATYVYDDVVELTAVPEPGWQFVGWTGAVTGTSPTISITMRKSETVTATFLQEQYDLDVNVVHNGVGTGGTVAVSPVKSTYVYGDVVTLSASLNPGWTFGGWSGDVTGSELEKEITITGDTAVTATFDQIRYEIDVTIIGESGQVTLNPQKDFYLYGDEVTLTADGGACWSFSQWGGDLAGPNPVELVTVTDDLSVTATFTQNTHTLTVNKVGVGTVTVTPDKAEYLCGENVTLQAAPGPNLFFNGWTGDLTGAQNPLTFAIEQDTVVTATFSDNPPPVVEPIPAKKVNITQMLTFQVRGSDPQGAPVTLSAVGLPPGATFQDNGGGNGTFTWRPSLSQAGEYSITFVASDGVGQGSQTVMITVEGVAIVLPAIIR